MSDRVLIHQAAAGRGAVTEIDGGMRRIVWDQPCKSVPRAVAEKLVLSGFISPAEPFDEACRRYGVSEQRMTWAVEANLATAAVHRPEQGDPFPVLVLDARTRAYLNTHATTGTEGATP